MICDLSMQSVLHFSTHVFRDFGLFQVPAFVQSFDVFKNSWASVGEPADSLPIIVSKEKGGDYRDMSSN